MKIPTRLSSAGAGGHWCTLYGNAATCSAAGGVCAYYLKNDAVYYQSFLGGNFDYLSSCLATANILSQMSDAIE